MNHEVKICIRGTHTSTEAAGDIADVVVETVGNYHYKDGKHYIRYEEISEEGSTSGNILKIENDKVELIRRGYAATHLYFETGNINYTYYSTMIGKLFIGINTKSLMIHEKNESIVVKIEYEMIMDGEKVSDSILEIEILTSLKQSAQCTP